MDCPDPEEATVGPKGPSPEASATDPVHCEASASPEGHEPS